MKQPDYHEERVKLQKFQAKLPHDSSIYSISHLRLHINFIGEQTMNMLIILAILLVINMLLMHGDKLVTFYYFIYKKIKKPKFKIGELVMIGGLEYQIIVISGNAPFYSYYCCPSYHPSICKYFHESRIDKKTGLLKELE